MIIIFEIWLSSYFFVRLDVFMCYSLDFEIFLENLQKKTVVWHSLNAMVNPGDAFSLKLTKTV
jgi:hypothetical protein